MLSKSNIKYIQSLQQKKIRTQEKLYVIEGPKMVEEALLELPQNIKTIYHTKEWTGNEAVKNIEIFEVEDFELAKISSLKTPNLVVALVRQEAEYKIDLPNNEWVLALDGIQDPGNLGTIIRIADWFGIKNIICSEDTVDQYNSKVLQSTMGSIFRTRVLYTNLKAFLEKFDFKTIRKSDF